MLKRLLGVVKRILSVLFSEFLRVNCVLLVRLFYDNIWNLRDRLLKNRSYWLEKLYYFYFEHYGAWVGLGAKIEKTPTFPHGLFGIFISNSARIGEGVVIFQQVTIGSNTLQDSKRRGAPTIGNNVYIGCGAKIIGNVNVGSNARIGANSIIVKDVPENSVAVIKSMEIIQKDNLDNTFFPNSY